MGHGVSAQVNYTWSKCIDTVSNGGFLPFAAAGIVTPLPGVPLYDRNPIPGVTQTGTIQWLNPNAFISSVDPGTGACEGGDRAANCLTKWFTLREHAKLRIEAQFFNLFNHANFGLPALGYAGIPGKPATQTGFGALTYTTSPPTGSLGVGLRGDSSPRMIAFQARLEF